MNIGDVSNLIKKDFPSISISRIRFLEKEGLIKPKRSKGGTRNFSDKDILKIKKVLDLQENQYYTLKAIKNNPKLLLGKAEKSKIIIDAYSKHEALKKSGLREEDFEELIDYKYETDKEIYTQEDVDRFSALAHLFTMGLGVKNLSVLKSMSERGVGFFESFFKFTDSDTEELKLSVEKFSEIIGSYILKDL